MNQRGQTQVLIMAGIAILIAIAGGIFFLGRVTAPKSQSPVITSSPQPSPSPDETANWKTYTNTKFGYSLKYPPDWENNLDLGVGYSLSPPLPPPPEESEYLFSGIDVSVLSIFNLEGFSLEEYSDADFIWNDATDKPKRITFNGFIGVERTYLDPEIEDPNYPFKSVYIQRSNKIYIIELSQQCSFPEVCINANTFDKIVSTFKLLDQGQIDADANNAKGLITNFYKAYEKQDGKLLFGYMTPPESSREKGEYSWLTGADLGSSAFYRAFLRVQLISPSFKNLRYFSDDKNDKFQIEVTDQMRTYSQVTTQWSEPKTRDVTFGVMRVNNNLLISYFNWDGNDNTKASVKYRGFPNVESN